MLGEPLCHELRGAASPARSEVIDPAPKGAIKLPRQSGDELIEECAHLAVHPFTGQRFLARQGQHDHGMRRSAADLQKTHSAVNADRALTAHDLQHGFAVHPGLTSDLVLRLVGAFDGVRNDARKAGIRIKGSLAGALIGLASGRFSLGQVAVPVGVGIGVGTGVPIVTSVVTAVI